MDSHYVIGLDYGTDSVRAVLIDTGSGEEISTEVFHYPRWTEGRYCEPASNQFRQHPLDYLEGLKHTITSAISKGPPGCAERVAAISIDTTGSTPIAIDKDGAALSLRPDFANNPNAMFILWKDHTAVAEADEINQVARTWGGIDFTRYVGGVYSSEWFYAKILHILRHDEKVRREAYSWVEHCDWLPAVLCGTTAPQELKRGVCAAGHKALWHESWGGLPSEDFFQSLDPLLTGLRERLFTKTYTADQKAGRLTDEWAAEFGLPSGIPVGIGAFDAHMGAVGGGIKPYSYVRVIGTSTCDMLIAPPHEMGDTVVSGICGQVEGSIIPGMIGMEAGQSAFGDVFAWFRDLLLWPSQMLIEDSGVDRKTAELLVGELQQGLLPSLSKAAEAAPVHDNGVIALDWLNGRRTPDANQALKSAITGLSLGSDAPRIFRALVEATAFGSKAIVERFLAEGIQINEVIAIGGVARKSPFAMKTLANVLNMEIKVARSDQTVALGAAMFAAVVGGVFPDIFTAQEKMACGIEAVYKPSPEHFDHYQLLYEKYKEIGAFVENKLT